MTLTNDPIGFHFREYLPAIDIAISGQSQTFLQQFGELAQSSGKFEVELHYDVMGKIAYDVANLRYLLDSPHKGLGVQLISDPDHLGRIQVEARAERWTPNPPTRTVYCEASRTLICPVLTAYNRAHVTRYRLRIEKPTRNKPRLSPRARFLFESFTTLANKSALHPLDWRRFYTFVRTSRRILAEETMRSMLESEGFSSRQACRIAAIYVHLAAFHWRK